MNELGDFCNFYRTYTGFVIIFRIIKCTKRGREDKVMLSLLAGITSTVICDSILCGIGTGISLYVTSRTKKATSLPKAK